METFHCKWKENIVWKLLNLKIMIGNVVTTLSVEVSKGLGKSRHKYLSCFMGIKRYSYRVGGWVK